MTIANVWAPLGKTVTLQSGATITSAGASVLVTDEIAGLLRVGILLSYDPTGINPNPSPLPPQPGGGGASLGVDPYDFGVLPTNDHWTNNVGLKAMRDYCLATDANALWTITFSKQGTYYYSFNKWLQGYLDYAVDLNGSSLRLHFPLNETDPVTGASFTIADYNTDTASFFWAGDYSFLTGETPPGINFYRFGGYMYHPGWSLATAAPGTFTVTLTDNATDRPYLLPGDPVFIGGWDPAFRSYPSPFQFFEYNEVADITGSVVTLRDRTSHRYESTWPRRTFTGDPRYGNARLFQLRGKIRNPAYASMFRGGDMVRNATFANGVINGTWTDADYGSAPHFFLQAYKSLQLVDLRVNAVHTIYNTDQTRLNNVQNFGYIESQNFGRAIEIDKNCCNVSFNSCVLPGIGGAQNVKSVSIRDSTVQRSCTLQPQDLLIENSFVGTSLNNQENIRPQYRASLKNVRVGLQDNSAWLRPQPFYNAFGSPGQAFQIATLSGDKTQVTFATTGGHSIFGGAGDPFGGMPFNVGDLLMRNDGGLYGRVLNGIDPQTFVVRWSGVPVVGEQYQKICDWSFDYDDNMVKDQWPGSLKSARGGSITLKSLQKDNWVVSPFFLPSVITSIVVDVTKAGGAGAYLWVRVFDDDGGQTLAHISTAQLGTRTITASGVTGGQSGDFPIPFTTAYTNLSTWRPRIRIDAPSGYTTPDQWPVFTLTFNCQQIAF